MSKLITITGIDGSGKTTQINNLSAYFSKQGISYHITRQPTSWYRELPEVRKYLDTGVLDVSLETLALLSAADRLRHIESEIKPRLNEGIVVICDRYVYSAYAYFKARGADMKFVKDINSKIIKPDIGFLLKMNPEESILRVRKRSKKIKFEEKDPLYLGKVQDFLIESISANFKIIDGMQSEQSVKKSIIDLIKIHLK